MDAATLPQSSNNWQARYRAGDLEVLFVRTFGERYRTRLQGGAEEPLYQPAASGDDWHRIVYAHDYFRSALHEIAHWCVAGEARRRQLDYGYWYAPDGRDAEQQRTFMTVEVAPQALELLFCAASGHPFRVSLDNLNGDPGDESAFAEAVFQRAVALLENPPQRAAQWIAALINHYGVITRLDKAKLAKVCQ